MSQLIGSNAAFVDRRARGDEYGGPERRQFRDSHESSHPDIREIAEAIDQYKLQNRRRFITYAELHGVISKLGYHK
jgi:hypothetical protein